MRIRLKADLPIEKCHGAFKGEIFETIKKTDTDPRAVWFKGRSGEECKTFFSEFDVVEDEDLSPPPAGCLC